MSFLQFVIIITIFQLSFIGHFFNYKLTHWFSYPDKTFSRYTPHNRLSSSHVLWFHVLITRATHRIASLGDTSRYQSLIAAQWVIDNCHWLTLSLLWGFSRRALNLEKESKSQKITIDTDWEKSFFCSLLLLALLARRKWEKRGYSCSRLQGYLASYSNEKVILKCKFASKQF